MNQSFDNLRSIMARLRAPDGCPWDREQTHATILQCLLDESYEFHEAVDLRSDSKMKEELGDLLLQVVFHSQMAAERGAFTIDDVIQGISEKLVRRHPHVFGTVEVADSKEVLRNWDKIKSTEPDKKDHTSVVDDIPAALPALLRAEKVQRRVSRVGFDWKEIGPVFDKVEEEFGELRAAIAAGDTANAREELGDIMFALVNGARHIDICAEESLRQTTNKFMRRFRYVEQGLLSLGKRPEDSTLEEMDRLWDECKAIERQSATQPGLSGS